VNLEEKQLAGIDVGSARTLLAFEEYREYNTVLIVGTSLCRLVVSSGILI
jgi:hypothetical protein